MRARVRSAFGAGLCSLCSCLFSVLFSAQCTEVGLWFGLSVQHLDSDWMKGPNQSVGRARVNVGVHSLTIASLCFPLFAEKCYRKSEEKKRSSDLPRFCRRKQSKREAKI